ncbi:Nn.00g042760.m01.CDS01 [Neocucurbitaria sp. VM-36]
MPHHLGKRYTASTAVDAGLFTWDQAVLWFESFFSGSQYLVPIFCEKKDTLASVSSRNAFLFDVIVSIGCRAEEGFNSATYRQLQARARDHITNLLIETSIPSLEDVQAITLMAAYSENGFVLIALALRFAIHRGLPCAIDELIARNHGRSRIVDDQEQELYRLTRIWHGICNLELFFSLDGGKLPGLAFQTSSRKIRSLVNHPERTSVDVRLLSQIELNFIRAEAYNKIVAQVGDPLLPQDETGLRKTVDDTTIELSLWLEEWTTIISTEPTPHQQSLALQNLHIQREWALTTLYLKAIATLGIENIAFMTDFQRDFVCRAKEAAIRHLHHVLEDSSTPYSSPTGSSEQHKSTYLSTFRWTLDYVWAKCAFSVLLVLKLAILLRDPVSSVMLLLRDAHRVLEELKRVTVGHIAYFQILQTSIEKCEATLKEYVTQNTGSEAASNSNGVAEDEFQGYVPSEFVFEWDFPGLNLKHMPLAWQELFINIDNIF